MVFGLLVSGLLRVFLSPNSVVTRLGRGRVTCRRRIAENLFAYQGENPAILPDLSCTMDGCCDGNDCARQDHGRHHTFFEKLKAGFGYAFGDLWQDMAVWFLAGLLLAGPATNLASLAVVAGTLGKRATGIYLSAIVLCSVMFGLLVDQLYAALGYPPGPWWVRPPR